MERSSITKNAMGTSETEIIATCQLRGPFSFSSSLVQFGLLLLSATKKKRDDDDNDENDDHDHTPLAVS